MTKKQLLIAASIFLLPQQADAKVSLNIYNNNLALVKDTRDVVLNSGRQKVYFDGVSARLNPESAFVLAKGIKVVEKNYDYNLINKANLLDHYVGKEVKVVVTNPENGNDIIKKAVVLANNYGSPVLQFDQGIEPDFSGRIIFDSLPKSLSAKPQLQVVLDNVQKGRKELDLLYLTSDISWKADYIVDVTSDKSFDLSTWVTLNNNTGVDYQDAQIRVVAGDINQAYKAPREEMYADQAMLKSSFAMGASVTTNVAKPVGDYYFYDIENNTTIKDKQSKQIALFNKQNVQYQKSYNFVSPLYVGRNSSITEFEKSNPSIVFNIKNDAQSNLNVLLPSGTIRFYEDKDDNTTFLGETQISQTAIGESLELKVGKTSDIYAKGKIKNVSQISKEISDTEVEVEFFNTKAEDKTINFEQNIYGDWRVVSESLASKKKNAKTASWTITIPASQSVILTYKIRAEN